MKAFRKTKNWQSQNLIETERLYMRRVEASDLDNYLELLSDPEVMRFVGIDTGKVLTDDEIRGLLDGAVRGWETRGWGRWSVFTKSGEFVGLCGFRNEDGVPDFITALHKRFWGRGYSVEAGEACLEYGIKHFRFDSIVAYTHPENKQAKRILTRLRARFEGDVPFHGITGSKFSFPALAAGAY